MRFVGGQRFYANKLEVKDYPNFIRPSGKNNGIN